MAVYIPRVVILAAAFFICMAEDTQMNDNDKCIYSDEDLEEVHLDECIDKVKPGGDVSKVYEEPEYLSEEENRAFSICLGEKLEILTADHAYSVEAGKKFINKLRAGTENSIVDAILAGVDECVKDKDVTKDGLEINFCVDKVYDKECDDEE